MNPYRERVAEVIKEEFTQQGITISDLPDRIQEALKDIELRIANDLEFMTQHSANIVAKLADRK